MLQFIFYLCHYMFAADPQRLPVFANIHIYDIQFAIYTYAAIRYTFHDREMSRFYLEKK
jgi:hypothetical protein